MRWKAWIYMFVGRTTWVDRGYKTITEMCEMAQKYGVIDTPAF